MVKKTISRYCPFNYNYRVGTVFARNISVFARKCKYAGVQFTEKALLHHRQFCFPVTRSNVNMLYTCTKSTFYIHDIESDSF
jgi:hypothetical protein